jgi:hypothetical protein
MSSPWPPRTVADVLHADAGFTSEEELEARAVEHTGHADDLVLGEAGDLLQLVDHRVERVRDDDDERVRTVLLHVGGDVADDRQVRGDEVVA